MLNDSTDEVTGSDVYVPTDEALQFIAFLRATNNEENTSPEVHYRIADALFSKDKKDWNLVIECTRGLGKSTTVEYAVIYIAALGQWPNFGKVPFLVFLGASLEGNVKAFFKNVQSKVENSSFLRSLLDINRCVDNEIELVNKDGVETIITGRGMGTNWRGIRSKRGDRPSILIADDILPSEVMTSGALRATIEMNWFNSALPALNPIKHKIIYVGTPLSEVDLLHKLKNSGEYRVERYPLCSKFPCSLEEYDSVWPDRFSYEYASKMYNQFYAAGKAQSFYTEYLLDVTDLSTLLVEESDIKWYDPKLLIKNKHLYNFYISTDFATSEKKSADYSTIGVWAVASDDSWFLVDGQCKRQDMMTNLEDLFRYVNKWKPLSVGIESSGQQGGFLSIISDMMMQKNIWFSLAKKRGSKDFGIRPTKDKTTRFVTGVQPKFKQGKIWLPKPELINHQPYLLQLLNELTSELSKFTLAGGNKSLAHDDAIDLLNQLSEMDIYTPDDAAVDTYDKLTVADNNYWDSPFDKEEVFGGSTVF
jgi:phage terminase large subunit-like protein